jgi:hypothetical protein
MDVIALLIWSVAFFFSACASSRLASVWRDPAYNLGPMKRMIIISISKDPVRRRLWEDVFVSELTKYGVAADPSYGLFPDNLPDTNQIAYVIQQNGYDGMMIISRLRTQIQTTTVEPYVSQIPITTYNPWRKKYVTRYDEEYHPGHTDTLKIVRNEVVIWAAKENSRMVWSGMCMTTDPLSSQQVHDETADLVVPMLAKAGLLPPRQ